MNPCAAEPRSSSPARRPASTSFNRECTPMRAEQSADVMTRGFLGDPEDADDLVLVAEQDGVDPRWRVGSGPARASGASSAGR